MPKFEVHIPATDPGAFTLTLKVNAENWMAALKAGMQKLGEQGTVSQNVMVDIQEDNSIHVTESASGRVFRIRELSEEEAGKAQVKRPSQIRPPPQRAEVKTAPGLPPDLAKTQPISADALPREALAATTPGAPAMKLPAGNNNKTLLGMPAPAPAPRPQFKSSPRIPVGDVEELVQPVKPPPRDIGRPRSSPDQMREQRQSAEDMLADIFFRVADLQQLPTVEAAMEFILDLAMEKVPCEAGSVLKSDGATGDLTFLVARGPKAVDLLRSKLVVPVGTGIAGFCAAEGVSVALSDAEKDPRFYAEIGERIGFETRSLLCSPMMTHGHSFGCVELINRKGGAQFLEHEVGVLAYLAHQAALYLNQKLLE